MSDLGARLLATVNVGGEPEWVGVGEGAVWITNRGLGLVQRVDPASNTVIASVPINEPCNGLTFGFGSVWTASCKDRTLVRIDPTGNKVAAVISTPIASDGEGQVTAGFGSIWISGGDGQLHRLDPATNRFITSIPVPQGADAVASDSTAIWVTDPAHSTLLRIDPLTNTVVSTIPVGPHPQFLATDDASVWVLNQDDGTVSRVTPPTGHVATINAKTPGRDVGCIAAGLGAAWVTIPDVPLTRIDDALNAVTERFTGPGGDCIAAGFGAVWLVNNALGTVYRIAPAV